MIYFARPESHIAARDRYSSEGGPVANGTLGQESATLPHQYSDVNPHENSDVPFACDHALVSSNHTAVHMDASASSHYAFDIAMTPLPKTEYGPNIASPIPGVGPSGQLRHCSCIATQ